ncbi:exosortase A [Aestuariirhabdus sp. Z084]|uniref:exosortase A n=1 Tax=Aestuariirhabdus haliotis TaxID=2918751 RepID=UPI00201B3CF0|nr:exosortase A [Aestuariirhabdus haliotis]MCL6414682.1 exosortase A [Aestuariirhabdus haliotis]MCL6418614.1 exosortase A [Aestuariirhabdus haliotis]
MNRQHSAWAQALIAYSIGFLVLMLAFSKTLFDMIAIWERSGTFNHCYIIAPICLYLIYRKRQLLVKLSPEPSLLGFVFLLCAIFVWVIAGMVEVQVVQQFSLVIMLSFLCLAVMGWKVVLTILFPLCYSLFMVPFGEFLILPMMELTASFTVSTIALFGIPIYVEGLYFELPTGHWSVVEGCSGVRYLIASVALGTLYAYLNYQTIYKRLIFIGASILLPIVGNWLRATGIVMLGHFSGMKLAVGVDHLLYGWVFFGVLMLILFWVGSRWSEAERSGKSFLQVDKKYSWLRTLTMVFILVPVSMWATQATSRNGDIETPVLEIKYNDKVLTKQTYTLPFRPRFTQSDSVENYTFEDHGINASLQLYWYGYGNKSGKLVTSTNQIVAQKDPEWRSIKLAKSSDECPAGNFVKLQSKDKIYYVASWYVIGGHKVCDPLRAKFSQLIARLAGSDEQGAHVVLTIDEVSEASATKQVIDISRRLMVMRKADEH